MELYDGARTILATATFARATITRVTIIVWTRVYSWHKERLG